MGPTVAARTGPRPPDGPPYAGGVTNDGSRTLEGTPNPEAPNPQLPIVQKLRLRYAKRGRMRFTSHRDFARAFERAIRRAGLPIGHSSGYTPHPKISYAGASPTGAASEAEQDPPAPLVRGPRFGPESVSRAWPVVAFALLAAAALDAMQR